MKNIARIIKLARPLYRLTFILSVLIVIGALMQLVAPVLSKFIVDEIVVQIQTGEGRLQTLYILIAASFTISLISTAITSITNRLGDHFAGRLQKFLTETFYAKILALPQSYFDSELSGRIINQLSRGILTIKGFANTSTNFILPTLLQSVLTVGILAYFSPPIAFFVFLLFPIYLYISNISARKWGKEEIKKNKLEDLGRGRIQEVISNMKLVKSANMQLNEYKYIQDNQGSINQIYAKQSGTFHRYDFVRNLSLIIIVLIVNLLVFNDAFNSVLSVGDMVLIIQLVINAQMPLFAMSFILTQLQTAESGSKEFFEILSLKESESFINKDDKFVKIDRPSIEFKNVSFTYDQSDIETLHDVNFAIKPGEKVALVGHSGAGKSTVINLLLRFYEPSKGKILINNTDYTSFSVQDIRNNISLVFQENELFSSTVRHNVMYGHPNATEEEVISALKKANAYEFVQNLAGGLDAEIGEKGIKLSGGQKQRLQIARAILADSPILILDEATSSLDSKSEQLVQEAMERLMREKLVIIIAHRFSTIQNVDKIIVIDKGRIADSGSPQDLADKQGIYSELLQYQLEGNKKLLKNFEIF